MRQTIRICPENPAAPLLHLFAAKNFFLALAVEGIPPGATSASVQIAPVGLGETYAVALSRVDRVWTAIAADGNFPAPGTGKYQVAYTAPDSHGVDRPFFGGCGTYTVLDSLADIATTAPTLARCLYARDASTGLYHELTVTDLDGDKVITVSEEGVEL